MGPILLPMAIAGVGIIISIIGTMLVKIKVNDAKESEVMGALNIGNWTSIALVAISCFGLVTWMLPETMKMNFFGEGLLKFLQCVYSMHTCRFSCWCCYFFCYRILYRIR